MSSNSGSGQGPPGGKGLFLFGANAGSKKQNYQNSNPVRNAPPKKKVKSKAGTGTKAIAGGGKGRGKKDKVLTIKGNGTQSLSQWMKPKYSPLFIFKSPSSSATGPGQVQDQDLSRSKILISPSVNQVRTPLKSIKPHIKTPNSKVKSKLERSFIENQNQITECISPGSTKVNCDEINEGLLNDLLDIEVNSMSTGDNSSPSCSTWYLPTFKDLNIDIDEMKQNIHLWDKMSNLNVDDIILKGCELDHVMEKVDSILYQGSLSKRCLCGNVILPRKKVDQVDWTKTKANNFTKSLKSTPILDNYEKNRVSIPSFMKNSNENDVTYDFGNTSKGSNHQVEDRGDFCQFDDNSIMMDIDIEDQEIDSKVQSQSKSYHDNINVIEDSCTDFEDSFEKVYDTTKDEKQQQKQQTNSLFPDDDDDEFLAVIDLDFAVKKKESQNSQKSKIQVQNPSENQQEVEKQDESTTVETIDESEDTDRIFKDFKTPESLKNSFSRFKPQCASSPMPLNVNATLSPIIHRSSLVIKADLQFEQDSCRDMFSPSPSKPNQSSKNELQLSPEIIYSSSQKRSQNIRQKLLFSKSKNEDSKENENHQPQPPLSPEIRTTSRSSQRISHSQKERDQEKQILNKWYEDYWNTIQPELEEKELNIIERKRDLEIEENQLIKLRAELAEAERIFTENKKSLEVDERKFRILKIEVESKKEKYESDNLLISHNSQSQGFQVQNPQSESQTQWAFTVQSQKKEQLSNLQEYTLKTPKSSKFVFKKKELTPLPPSFPKMTSSTTTNKNNIGQEHQTAKNPQQQQQPAKSLVRQQRVKNLLQQQPFKSFQQQQQMQQKPSTSTGTTDHNRDLNAMKKHNEIIIDEDSSDDDFVDNNKPVISTKRKKPQDKKQIKVKLPKKKYRRVIKNPYVNTQAGCSSDSDNGDDSTGNEEELDDSFVTHDDVVYTETQQVRYLMKKESPITSARSKFSKPYEAACNLVSRGIENSDEEQYEEDSFCNDDVEYAHIGDYTQAIIDAVKDNEEEARQGGPPKRKLRKRK